MTANAKRNAALRRSSRETDIVLALDLDGGEIEVDTGVGFLDHMLRSLALHAGWGLGLACSGDLEVDEHHSVEDCALALGEALSRSLAAGPSPKRFGTAYAPLDESLARAVVDLSGRPYCVAELGLAGARLGELAGENVAHFLYSLAMAARLTLHVDVLRGENAHHRAEAAFKALALALREASAPAAGAVDGGGGEGRTANSPTSAKGNVALETMSEADFADRARAVLARRGARGGRQ